MTFNDAWHEMQRIARAEVQRLMTEFPEYGLDTNVTKGIAELFCTGGEPTDEMSLALRQIGLTGILSHVDHMRTSLLMRRNIERRFK